MILTNTPNTYYNSIFTAKNDPFGVINEDLATIKLRSLPNDKQHGMKDKVRLQNLPNILNIRVKQMQTLINYDLIGPAITLILTSHLYHNEIKTWKPNCFIIRDACTLELMRN